MTATPPQILEQVELFLASNKVAASRLGRDALGDPRFVLELRAGRKVRAKTLAKLNSYMGGEQWRTPE